MSLDQLGHAFRALAGCPLVAPLLAEIQIVRDCALQRANFSLEFRVGKHQLRKRDGVRPDVLCLGKIIALFQQSAFEELSDPGRAFGRGLPNALIATLAYNPTVDVFAAGAVGRGVVRDTAGSRVKVSL